MFRSEVTIVGSTMIDLVTYVEALPKVGETVFGKSFQKSFGGKGANQAVQCARLGVKSLMVGVVGMNDTYGKEYLQQFEKEGVEVNMILQSETSNTGTASIQVDNNGQNSIIIVQGANLDLLPSRIPQLEDAIKEANVVICQNEIPFETTLAALSLCKVHGTVSILNPAPANLQMLELVHLCDIFCPNEVELAVLTGLPAGTDDEVRAAAESLLEKGCSIVLVTLGARGACLARRGECKFFDTERVQAVDTVGAGDSFIGSLASNLARNASIEDAIQRALHCASLSVLKKGAQASYPTLTDLQSAASSNINGTTDYCPPALPASGIGDKFSIRASLNL